MPDPTCHTYENDPGPTWTLRKLHCTGSLLCLLYIQKSPSKHRLCRFKAPHVYIRVLRALGFCLLRCGFSGIELDDLGIE